MDGGKPLHGRRLHARHGAGGRLAAQAGEQGGDDPDPDEGGEAHARLGRKQLLLVLPKCMLKPESIRKDLELRIELGYYKPPHKPTETFYDMSYWTEATGEPAPPPAGLPRNAVAC